jgi:hypothetical protein
VDANSKIDQKNKTDLLDQDKYIVETVLMDDLVEAFPLRRDGQVYKKACIKMDIEGFEPFAFQHSELFFSTLSVEMLIIEWPHLLKQDKSLVENLVNVLSRNGLKPFSITQSKEYNPKEYTSWSDGEIIRKKSFKKMMNSSSIKSSYF